MLLVFRDNILAMIGEIWHYCSKVWDDLPWPPRSIWWSMWVMSQCHCILWYGKYLPTGYHILFMILGIGYWSGSVFLVLQSRGENVD